MRRVACFCPESRTSTSPFNRLVAGAALEFTRNPLEPSPTHSMMSSSNATSSEVRILGRKPLGLPPVPRTQALTSTTFRPPPLDGSLAIPELWDWHYEHSPQHPLFIYSDDEGTATTITWREACRAIHQAGHIARRLVLQDGLSTRPTFAILAGNGTFPPLHRNYSRF